MSKPIVRPELLDGNNPLLEPMAPYVPFPKWPEALKHEPLKGVDWRSVAPEYRSCLLLQSDKHYWPTRLILDLADSLQALMRGGLMARNPLSVAEQRRINALALTESVKAVQLQSLRAPAGGGIVSAITGMGKSAALIRTLKVIAPDQVVVHGRSEACGWSSLTQVLYLVIDMPFNGTRRGLFTRIAEALDTLLGTDYSETLRKLRNLDAELLFITKLLLNHRVGLLAIDENQPDNFDLSIWQRSFVLLFLGLMNLGVPVVLLGNPLAFAGLESASQNMRRFSTAGYHTLMPAASPSEPWWSKDYIPGMCRYLLCEDSPPVAQVLESTFEASAGVPGLFGPLWVEAQRIALRRGGTRACLTSADLVSAKASPRVRQLIAIASQVTGNVQRFVDIPPNRSAATHSSQVSADTMDSDGLAHIPNAGERPIDPLGAVRTTLERKIKAAERRAASRMDKLDPTSEELRDYEVKMEHFAGIKDTQEPLLTSGKRAPPKLR